MQKKCTKCEVVGTSPELFRPDRSVCRKCSSKDRRRLEAALDTFESDQTLLDSLEEGLIPFGTPIERCSLRALLAHSSVADAAEELQLEPRQLRAHMSELQRRAAGRGYSPGNDMTKTAPEGFSVKGVSTLYDGNGNIRGQWVKTHKDTENQLAALIDAFDGAIEARAQPIAIPDEHLDEDLLNVLPLGDPHIGMFSWSPETGNNFDLKIAEQNLFAAVDQLVSLAPPAKRALVISLGDLLHADGKGNTTTAGTPVDVDGRWSKVVTVGIRVMRRMIDRCLERHAEVHVVCEIGNHDANTSLMLALCLAQFYENEPRVFIDTSPAKFHWFRFGQNLIGITHGDTVKAKDLPGIMACDRAKDWGETQHRAWYCGHVHHDTVKEYPGVTVETFRTLAPGDAWHNGQGYRSGRDSKLIVLHREWGEIQRHTVGIRKVCAAGK